MDFNRRKKVMKMDILQEVKNVQEFEESIDPTYPI